MYVKVRVIPKAKRESLKEEKGVLHISVREPAERNLANERVRELVAEYFQVGFGKVRLVAGHRSPLKVFAVDR